MNKIQWKKRLRIQNKDAFESFNERNSSDPESMTRIRTSEPIKCLPESFILKISLALMLNCRSENLLVWIFSGVIRA